MKNFSSGHLLRNNIKSMKKFFSFMQDASPLKIHDIHIFNTVPFFHLVMALIRPFLKTEIANKVKQKRLSPSMSDASRVIYSRCIFIHHRLTLRRYTRSLFHDRACRLISADFATQWKCYMRRWEKSFWKWENILLLKRSKPRWASTKCLKKRKRDSRWKVFV